MDEIAMSYVVQVAEAKPTRGKSLAVGPEYRYDDFETFGRARGGSVVGSAAPCRMVDVDRGS